MIKAGDEVVALVTFKAYSGDKIIKGEVYVVERIFRNRAGDGELLIKLKENTTPDMGWGLIYNGRPSFRKVTRPRASASNEITKKLTEEVREGEKRREIEYKPATAIK